MVKLCEGILLQGGGACDNYEMIVAKIYQLLEFVVGKMLWLGF